MGINRVDKIYSTTDANTLLFTICLNKRMKDDKITVTGDDLRVST